MTTPTTDPSAAGLSEDALARLDSHIRRQIDNGTVTGGIALIARGGEIAHLSVQGLADRERSIPMSVDTIFRIYSMTKPLVSVALMQLSEQGLVQLDDPVHAFIPDWADLRVYESGAYPNIVTRRPDRPMTVRDLLSHQSGLTYGRFDDSPVDRAYNAVELRSPTDSIADLVTKLGALPLKFSPGTGWDYSFATDVVGRLVELISGQSLDSYLHDHISAPLGMGDTSFWVSPDKQARFATNYSPDGRGGLSVFDDPRASTYGTAPVRLSGGGGLTSTVQDYWRFALALRNGGEVEGQRLLGRKTLELMTANHLPRGADIASIGSGQWAGPHFAGLGFGLGFSVMLNPAANQLAGSAGEYSWSGAANTTFFVDPREDLVVIFMTQVMAESTVVNIRRQVRALVYAALT